MAETPRLHLFQDNTGRSFANGAPGVMANTLCMGNYRNYLTTTDRRKVTCHPCRAKLERR